MPFSLLPAPLNEAGGLLELEYMDAGIGERHALKVHVCHFDYTTFNYIGEGPKIPSGEADLGQTFSNLAATWAPYYPASWQMRLVSCWFNSGGDLVRLPTMPSPLPQTGSNGDANAFGPSVRRIYRTRSTLGRRRQFYLQQIPGDAVDTELDVTPSVGGFDARDRAFVAYLASAASGVCAPDGFPFAPRANVRMWWSRPLEAVATGGTAPSGVLVNG